MPKSGKPRKQKRGGKVSGVATTARVTGKKKGVVMDSSDIWWEDKSKKNVRVTGVSSVRKGTKKKPRSKR